MADTLATIAFQPEAFDSASAFFQLLTPRSTFLGGIADNAGRGYTVNAIPTAGEPFEAEVVDMVVGEDGQWKVVLARWDEDAGQGDRTQLVTLDIYDELERIEVI